MNTIPGPRGLHPRVRLPSGAIFKELGMVERTVNCEGANSFIARVKDSVTKPVLHSGTGQVCEDPSICLNGKIQAYNRVGPFLELLSSKNVLVWKFRT